MNCIIYTRFSPRPNADTCESCQTQEAACREYAAALGWTVIGAFADPDTSGGELTDGLDPAREIAKRPGLDAALRALRPRCVLLAYKWQRLGRSTMLIDAIRKRVRQRRASIRIIRGSNGEGPIANLAIGVEALMDQANREVQAQVTSDHMRQLQAQGRRVGRPDRCPYGSEPDLERDRAAAALPVPAGKRPNRWLRPVPEEQANIATIMELRAKGLGLRRIARRLNGDGRTYRGRTWTACDVQRILRAREQKRHPVEETTPAPQAS